LWFLAFARRGAKHWLRALASDWLRARRQSAGQGKCAGRGRVVRIGLDLGLFEVSSRNLSRTLRRADAARCSAVQCCAVGPFFPARILSYRDLPFLREITPLDISIGAKRACILPMQIPLNAFCAFCTSAPPCTCQFKRAAEAMERAHPASLPSTRPWCS
jgi:hypothetical protein